MADLYYNNATLDGSWDTAANWWLDSTYATPAVAIPQDSDSVWIDANLTNGPSFTIQISVVRCGVYNYNTFYVTLNANIQITTGFLFYNNAMHDGEFIGAYSFFDNSQNLGVIDSLGLTSGFYGNSINHGILSSQASFQDNSFNLGGCLGNTDFYGNSRNSGTIKNGFFSDLTYNAGFISENAFFINFETLDTNKFSDNLGYGIGSVLGTSHAGIDSIQIGVLEYINNPMFGEIFSPNYFFTVNFRNGTSNSGDINLPVVFYDTSYNIGYVLSAKFEYIDTAGTGISDDITSYATGIVEEDILDVSNTPITSWRFTTTQLQANAICQGNAIFSLESANLGNVTQNAYFYNQAFNAGSVALNATFSDNSYNGGNIGGSATYTSAYTAQIAIYVNNGTINGAIIFPFADVLGTGLQ